MDPLRSSLEEGLDHRELLRVPAAALAIGGGADLPQTPFFLSEMFAEKGKEAIHDTGCDGFRFHFPLPRLRSSSIV